MSTRLSRTLLLGLTLSGLAACSTPQPTPQSAPAPVVNRAPVETPRPVTDERSVPAPLNVALVDATTSDESALNKLRPVLRSVYFGFDQYDMDDQYMKVTDAHGKHMDKYRAEKVVIEGNTDSRGGREYNLALGAKRAEAVKRRLMVLGIDEGRIETVSFGKEKPKAQGSSESDHTENRRADFNYRRR